jgi:hypothetical protein
MSIHTKNRLTFDRYSMVVGPADFLRIVKRQDAKSNLLRVKFVMPRLGSESFGKFLLTYKHEPTKTKWAIPTEQKL